MRGRRWVLRAACVLAVALSAVSGCSERSSSDNTTGTADPRLSAAVERAVAEGDAARLGLAVVDFDTGAGAGHDADTPFRSASLSKLIVAVDVLSSDDVPEAGLRRLERALRASDDKAMNVLWTSHDGLGAVDRVASRAGLTATRPPEDASQWGSVEMSANDVVKLYRHITTELPADDRHFIVDALSDARATAADGFDQAFGLLAPEVDAETYAKQGWMSYPPSEFYLHTTGVVDDRYAVAVLSVHDGVAEQTAKDRLTAVTNALITALTPTG